jgi:hypothetical protein
MSLNSLIIYINDLHPPSFLLLYCPKGALLTKCEGKFEERPFKGGHSPPNPPKCRARAACLRMAEETEPSRGFSLQRHPSRGVLVIFS